MKERSPSSCRTSAATAAAQALDSVKFWWPVAASAVATASARASAAASEALSVALVTLSPSSSRNRPLGRETSTPRFLFFSLSPPPKTRRSGGAAAPNRAADDSTKK